MTEPEPTTIAPPRVVVDTNVLVAASYKPASASARLVAACFEGGLRAVVSPALAREYRDVIPKATRGAGVAALERFLASATWVDPIETPAVVSADPSDDMLFAAAIAGGAVMIATNDRPVLQVGSYRGARVARPPACLEDVLGELPATAHHSAVRARLDTMASTDLVDNLETFMAFRAILFDLDGTLLDTLADIASAGNEALASLGLPTHPVGSYREFIGDGIEVLGRRAIPAGQSDGPTLARFIDAYRDAYGRKWDDQTRPYEGIAELLDALAGRGLPIGVLSNKPDDFTRRCVDHSLGGWAFRVVMGARDDLPRKPDPAGALIAAERFGLPPSAVLYVGDTPTDMETARTAGMEGVGVTWGFRSATELRESGAVHLIDAPPELLQVLDGKTPIA